MRFTATAVAFAGAAAAGSTIYSTDVITITSCAPTVTNCPAHSTQVTSTVYPVTASTIYTTTVKTITSCAPEVTNCPGKTGYVVTQTIPVSTTLCPISQATPYGNGTWVPPTKSAETVAPPPTGAAGSPPPPPNSPAGGLTTTYAPACPTYSVKTISTSVTTVVPTVIYETVAVPCPTSKPVTPVGTGVPVPPPAGGNATVPVTKPTTPVTAGAASLSGSVILAAAAGLAAAILA